MAPPTFTPISVANRWKAGEVTSSPSLISDAFDCSKRGPVKALHAAIALSLKVESRPLKVFDCACIPPPKALPMPSSRILIALPAGSKPFSLIFWASAVVIPMPSESNCHAGIPTSASCIISCALTLPFACICPRAVVTRSISNAPPPRAETASPTLCSIGRMLCAEKPKASILLAELVMSGNSKGVSAANFQRSLTILDAASPLWSRVPKATVVCSMSALEPTSALPRLCAPWTSC